MIRSVLFLVFITSALTAHAQSKNENYYRVLAISKVDSNLWSASNRVRAVTPIKMEIPTAFSPNEDGLNDSFGVLANGLE